MLSFVYLYSQQNNNNQTPYYYWYQGNKVYLNLNTTGFYLDVMSDFNESQLNNQDLLPFILTPLDEPTNGNFGKWATIEINSTLTENDYFQKIEGLKQLFTSINLIQPSFTTMEGNKIYLTSYFYVKLNHFNDLPILQQEANNKNVQILRQNPFMPLWYILKITPQTTDNTLNIANYFYETGYFASAEPNFLYYNYLQCANDPLFSQQWGLKNTVNNVGYPGIDIQICDAWSFSTGNNITVAIVDNGIELNHPDLQNVNSSLSYNASTGTSPSAEGNHGTAVAGIVGATKGNGIGIAGVAPDVNLLSISVRFNHPTTEERAADGINWAWQNGADVINNSWGGGSPSNIITDAISHALIYGRDGKGSVVVFASGNNNRSSIDFPASSHPDVLAVGAMSPCGERKNPSSCDGNNWGSNYGSGLSVVAPGVLIATTDFTGSQGYNNQGDYHLEFRGTSAAAPFVSGVAAIVLSINPDLTNIEVNNIIESTASKIGPYTYQGNGSNDAWSNQMGYGLVNAGSAALLAYNIFNGDCESDIIIYGPDILPFGQQATYSTNYGSVGYVEWSAIGLDIISTDENGNAIVESSGANSGYLTATIGCKATTMQITIYQQEMVVPYPNAADSFFSLDFSTYPPDTLYYIYIYDQFQNTVYSGETTNVVKTINTEAFPTDTYFLHIYIEGELTAKQLYVQH